MSTDSIPEQQHQQQEHGIAVQGACGGHFEKIIGIYVMPEWPQCLKFTLNKQFDTDGADKVRLGETLPKQAESNNKDFETGRNRACTSPSAQLQCNNMAEGDIVQNPGCIRFTRDLNIECIAAITAVRLSAVTVACQGSEAAVSHCQPPWQPVRWCQS